VAATGEHKGRGDEEGVDKLTILEKGATKTQRISFRQRLKRLPKGKRLRFGLIERKGKKQSLSMASHDSPQGGVRQIN
jgi:hypothetical protein